MASPTADSDNDPTAPTSGAFVVRGAARASNITGRDITSYGGHVAMFVEADEVTNVVADRIFQMRPDVHERTPALPLWVHLLGVIATVLAAVVGMVALL
jgi:hypothetical protein